MNFRRDGEAPQQPVAVIVAVIVGAPGATCHDECGPNEYGVACGRVGPSGVSSDPPSPNCRTPGFTPGGTAFYCCPCGP